MNTVLDHKDAPSSPTTMFFVVGAGKAGTTWLYDYLSSHGQVTCGPVKEYSYHTYFWRMCGRGRMPFWPLQRFLAKMSLARRTGKARGYLGSLIFSMFRPLDYKETIRGTDVSVRAFGDISPRYATLGADAYAYAWMRDMHPKTKFVFVMREPVDRLWSSAQMNAQEPRYSKRAKKKDFLKNHVHNELAYESMNYPRVIKALDEVIPQEDIIYLFYEKMFEQSEMDRLCKELGVDRHPAAIDKKVFAGAKAQMPEAWAREMYNELKHMYDFVEARFPTEIPDYWKLRAAEYERVGV